MAATTPGNSMKPGHLVFLTPLTVGLVALLGFLVLRVEQPPDKARAFPRGEIVVGVDGSFPPFANDDGEKLTGLDIELATAIAVQIDLPLRFVNIGYYGLYDALVSGKVDMLISALRVDPARMDDVRYTRHYFDNGLVLVSPLDAALNNAGSLADRRIAFEIGSQADAELRELEAQPVRIQRFPYELPNYALDAARLGIADAAIVDATALRQYQAEYPAWQNERFHLTREYYAIALPSGRPDAWKLADDALAALIESGQLATIIDNWL